MLYIMYYIILKFILSDNILKRIFCNFPNNIPPLNADQALELQRCRHFFHSQIFTLFPVSLSKVAHYARYFCMKQTKFT